MKKSTLLSLAAVTALFITACGNASSPKEENHDGHDHSMHEAASAAVQINDEKLNAVYQKYLKLNLALVNSDEAAAKVAANTLELGAKELDNGSVVASSAAKITEATSIKEERAAFSDLSNSLIELVKKSGLKSGELYVDYCPMALNDQGAYWLSSEKGIKNPYFGDSMLTCGETKETI